METTDTDIARRRSRDGRQSCLVAGAPVAGRPPVLLIHGLGWDAARLWSGQMARLAGAGWQGVAPDLRGVGGSAPIARPIGIPDYGGDVVALLREMEVARPVIVGFSMGCMVAMDLVARGVEPAGLMLACGGVASTPEGQAGTEAMLARVAGLDADGFAAEQAKAIWSPGWAAANPGAVAEFRGWRAAMDQESLFHAFRAPFGCDYSGVLGRVACPSAVVAAGADRFVPVGAMRDLAVRLPGATFHEIAGAGHMAPIEAPDAFEAALAALLARVAAWA